MTDIENFQKKVAEKKPLKYHTLEDLDAIKTQEVRGIRKLAVAIICSSIKDLKKNVSLFSGMPLCSLEEMDLNTGV